MVNNPGTLPPEPPNYPAAAAAMINSWMSDFPPEEEMLWDSLRSIVGWGERLISTIVGLKEALRLQDGARKECFSWSFSDGLILASLQTFTNFQTSPHIDNLYFTNSHQTVKVPFLTMT